MTQATRIAIENQEGVTVRTMAWPESQGSTAHLIRRNDTKRLELTPSMERLDREKVGYDKLLTLERSQLVQPVPVPGIGVIRAIEEAPVAILKNEVPSSMSPNEFRKVTGAVVVGALIFMSIVLTRPMENQQLEEQLKQQVVQIVKEIKVKPQVTRPQANVATTETPTTVKPTQKTASIKRMGALAVFGSLKNGSQKGGVNLGAVNTTAGPGLGGNAGSGGVQSSIYAKGLVAAPLGAGGNMAGGGGYGTKGKGGGQAGYGKLSLVGSAGVSPIPLGAEAIEGGGLDSSLIADVINRNLGQIRFCYEQGLQGDPALAGRVAVKFVIGGNGAVKTALVDSTTLNSKLVEDCILLRLRTWKFPLPAGGSDVKVSYPFVLRRTGQG
ncbi:MAG TPA: AgmX/PglI C-terminal domain-containing protein [Pseudobdellovibrionaceae bacterium]|nr:AgmX/PglI C-terminal domain-containing protein [Pseudobdellovibrionaceae bacterium]